MQKQTNPPTGSRDFPGQAVPMLLDWYRGHARDLPWRHTTDPYRVLVSEIMLQQTRAETVIPYYLRFMETLPTVKDLAEADDATLLKLWEGLGYYNRVRNLARAARVIMTEYGGVFPDTYPEIRSLPGVGPYTAGAVASICFGLTEPAVDGNVLRVWARITGDGRDVLQSGTKAAAHEAIRPIVPENDAGTFTQSMIEIGATVCTPASPHCSECPVSLFCVACAGGLWDRLPVRGRPADRRVEQLTVLVIHIKNEDGKDAVLLRKRPDRGLLSGMTEFPNFPGHLTREEAVSTAEKLGIHIEKSRELGPARHLFTHIEWQMTGYELWGEILSKTDTDCFAATPSEMAERLAIPSAFSTYLSVLFQ